MTEPDRPSGYALRNWVDWHQDVEHASIEGGGGSVPQILSVYWDGPATEIATGFSSALRIGTSPLFGDPPPDGVFPWTGFVDDAYWGSELGYDNPSAWFEEEPSGFNKGQVVLPAGTYITALSIWIQPASTPGVISVGFGGAGAAEVGNTDYRLESGTLGVNQSGFLHITPELVTADANRPWVYVSASGGTDAELAVAQMTIVKIA